MASFENSKALKNAFQNLRNFNLEKVVRKNLGSEAFESAQKVAETLFKIEDRISPFITEIDDVSIQELHQSIIEILSNFNQISNYDNAKFLSLRANYAASLSNQKERAIGIWSKVLALIHELEKSSSTNKIDDPLIRIKDEVLENAEEIKLLRNRLVHEVDDFEKRYTTTFQKAEINKQAEVFVVQANKFLSNSKFWAIGVLLTSILLIIIIVCIFKNFCFEVTCFDNLKNLNYNNVCEDCNRVILYLEIFKAIFFRLFIISFILYILNFCIKNYNASMHNYTINTHKANSLGAAERLIERLYSEKAKDEVLTNASNAIFSHQPTGYSNKDPENLKQSIMEKVIEKVDPSKNIE